MQENVVATGGADGSVQLYDLQQQQSLGQLAGHTKRVTAVQFASPQLLISSSADKTLRMWAPPADASEPGAGFACASVLSEHSAAVVGLAVHPSHHYCVSASEDASWCFWDLKQATCLKQVCGWRGLRGQAVTGGKHPMPCGSCCTQAAVTTQLTRYGCTLPPPIMLLRHSVCSNSIACC
jgi:hypothetical protein